MFDGIFSGKSEAERKIFLLTKITDSNLSESSPYPRKHEIIFERHGQLKNATEIINLRKKQQIVETVWQLLVFVFD